MDRRVRTKELGERQREAVRELMSGGGEVDPQALEDAMLRAAKGSKKKQGDKKPLWAMTVEEKDATEEAEADDLIDFVEHLDFDSYIGDLEFRQRLTTSSTLLSTSTSTATS